MHLFSSSILSGRLTELAGDAKNGEGQDSTECKIKLKDQGEALRVDRSSILSLLKLEGAGRRWKERALIQTECKLVPVDSQSSKDWDKKSIEVKQSGLLGLVTWECRWAFMASTGQAIAS